MRNDVFRGVTVADVLERVLDKGIVVDAHVRVSVASIHLVELEARIVVASVETYLKHQSELRGLGHVGPPGGPRFLLSDELDLHPPGLDGDGGWARRLWEDGDGDGWSNRLRGDHGPDAERSDPDGREERETRR